MEDNPKLVSGLPLIVTKLTGNKRKLCENFENNFATISHDYVSLRNAKIAHGKVFGLALRGELESQRTVAPQVREMGAAQVREMSTEKKNSNGLDSEKAMNQIVEIHLKHAISRFDAMLVAMDKLNADAIYLSLILTKSKANIHDEYADILMSLKQSTDLV